MTRRKVGVLALLTILVVVLIIAAQPASACFEGCTPGYWKNHVTVPPWPTQVCVADEEQDWMFPMPPDRCSDIQDIGPEPWEFLVQDVFTIPDCLLTDGDLDLNGDGAADTLLDALNYQGGEDVAGKAEILLRAAVASVLNSGTMAHKPAYSVISIVNQALDKGCTGRMNLMQYWSRVFDENNNQGGPLCPK